MGLIDRFTRDGVSKVVWAGLMLAAIAGLVFAMIHGDAVVARERAAAQARAVAYVDRVLDPRVGDASSPITGPEASSLRAAVGRDVLTDERVERVRVWSSDGRLLFSTEGSDRVGSNAGLNDQLLDRVASGETVTRSNVSDTGGATDPERTLLRTYVPLGSSIVAEVDQSDAGTVAIARTEWRWYQLLAGGAALLFLVFTALSLRDPIEPINAGVPFAASSIPAGYSLIDDERLHAVNEVYRLSNERVAHLQGKLADSEEIRRQLQGDVQRALTKAATTGTRPVQVAKAPPPEDAPAPRPTPAVTPVTPVTPAAPAAPPPVVRVPESDVVRPKPLGDAWVAAAAGGPLARANRDQKPPPAAAKPKPAAARKPKREPRRRMKKTAEAAATKAAAVPQPAPTTPTKAAPAPASEPPAASSRRARKVAAVAAASAASSAAPAPTPPARPASPDREVEDARAHEAALETFIRLTESDRQPHDTSDVDQGAIRAALARTAARKKPGGERLQLHEGEDESPAEPRRSD